MGLLFQVISLGFALISFALSEEIVSRPAMLHQARQLIERGDLSSAAEILDRAKARDSKDTEVLYLRGYVLYRLRRLDLAKQDLKVVLSLAPPALQSRYLLGRISELEHQNAEAIRWLEPCAHVTPPVEDAPARLSKLYWASGQLTESLTWTQKALSLTPWEGSLHYRLGRIYQQTGKLEQAKREFDESARSKSTDAQAVSKLMNASRSLAAHDMESALAIRKEFLYAKDLDPDVLVALGTAFANAGSTDEALELYRTAAIEDPQSFQAQFNFGFAELNLRRPEKAVEPLTASLRLFPQSKEANSALALAYVLQGKFSEAVPPLETAHTIDPDDSRTLGLLSLAYYRTGASTKAVPLLQGALRKSKGDPKFYFLLIDCLNATENQNEALTVADEAVRLFPDLSKAWLAKGQQLARLGWYHEAGPLFAKASELDPRQVEPLFGYAEARQKDGDYKGALDTYQQTYERGGGVTSALGIARNFVFLGQLQEARTVLEKEAAAHPDNRDVHYELSRVYARLGEKALALEQTQIVQHLQAESEHPGSKTGFAQ